jgi:CRP-like cAMP-binding protein
MRLPKFEGPFAPRVGYDDGFDHRGSAQRLISIRPPRGVRRALCPLEGAPEPAGNRILDAFPREVYERLRPGLEVITLASRDVVYEPHGPIPHVYFPTTCVVSLLAIMGDGSMHELTTVGREGMIGLPVFLETATAPYRTITQIPGDTLRLDADKFREALGRSAAATRLLHRHAQVLFNQVAWSTACGRAHRTEQRCARWLLMTYERVGAGQFSLTQEFMAQMLGVRRAGVNQAAGALQKAGLIRYTRGRITVLDRTGLEAASCECYCFIRDEYERLLA